MEREKNKKNISLIVNADDFGLTDGINRGIITSFCNGIVTRASIMANGDFFDHAVSLAKQNPGLGIGVHLTLIAEKPVSPPEKIRSLINDSNLLHKNCWLFLRKYFFGKIQLTEISREIDAQIKKILDNGIRIIHIDSHQHLHLLPGIFETILEGAKKFKINNIRIPAIDYSEIRSIEAFLLGVMSYLNRKKLINTSLRFADNFWGFNQRGNINEENLLDFLDRVKPGVTEIMCHPGFSDEEYSQRYSSWGYSPETELGVFTSQQVKFKLQEKRIELIKEIF